MQRDDVLHMRCSGLSSSVVFGWEQSARPPQRGQHPRRLFPGSWTHVLATFLPGSKWLIRRWYVSPGGGGGVVEEIGYILCGYFCEAASLLHC